MDGGKGHCETHRRLQDSKVFEPKLEEEVLKEPQILSHDDLPVKSASFQSPKKAKSHLEMSLIDWKLTRVRLMCFKTSFSLTIKLCFTADFGHGVGIHCCMATICNAQHLGNLSSPIANSFRYHRNVFS